MAASAAGQAQEGGEAAPDGGRHGDGRRDNRREPDRSLHRSRAVATLGLAARILAHRRVRRRRRRPLLRQLPPRQRGRHVLRVACPSRRIGGPGGSAVATFLHHRAVPPDNPPAPTGRQEHVPEAEQARDRVRDAVAEHPTDERGKHAEGGFSKNRSAVARRPAETDAGVPREDHRAGAGHRAGARARQDGGCVRARLRGHHRHAVRGGGLQAPRRRGAFHAAVCAQAAGPGGIHHLQRRGTRADPERRAGANERAAPGDGERPPAAELREAEPVRADLHVHLGFCHAGDVGDDARSDAGHLPLAHEEARAAAVGAHRLGVHQARGFVRRTNDAPT